MFFSYESAIRAYKGAHVCPFSAALSCKVQVILALESALIVFILYIHLSLM